MNIVQKCSPIMIIIKAETYYIGEEKNIRIY